MLKPAHPEFSFERLMEQRWQQIRQHRNVLLKDVDIKINKLEDQGQDAAPWRTYRQELRDLPTTTDNPNELVWPIKPE